MVEPKVGDENQRYEVRCLDGNDKEMVMGWTDEADGGGLARSVELHPVWHNCTVIDRNPCENCYEIMICKYHEKKTKKQTGKCPSDIEKEN